MMVTYYPEENYNSGFTITVSLTSYPSSLQQNDEMDVRYNPKMWAKWFQEFLYELYGRFLEVALRNESYTRVNAFLRVTKLPLKREWIFKDWIQKLRTTV